MGPSQRLEMNRPQLVNMKVHGNTNLADGTDGAFAILADSVLALTEQNQALITRIAKLEESN